MNDQKKSKVQLIEELTVLRQRVAELERAEVERKQAEEFLRESERLLTDIAANYPNSYLSIIEKDLTIGFTSGQEFKKQNLDPQGFVGLSLEQVFGEHTPIVKEHYLKTFQGEETSFELCINKQHQLFKVVPLYDQQGQITRILAVVENITERKRVEEKLRHTAEELQRVMASISDYLWSGEVDEEGNWAYHYYSPVVEKITGRPPAFYLDSPQRWLGTIHPDDRSRLLDATQRILSGQTDREEEEYRVVHSDGTICWVRDCATVTRLGPRRRRVDGVVSDITERKRAEEALQKSHEELRAFFLQTIDGCFFMMLDTPVRWDDTTDKEEVLDYVFAHQRITQINEAMLAQYGATREQMLNLTPNDLFQHNLTHGRDLWRQLFDAGKIRLESDERKLDGTPMWIEGEYITLYDSEGRITGHFGIQRDITERKRAEQKHLAHLRFFESMDQINRTIQGTNDLEQMMSDVLDLVLSIFECDRAWFVYPCDPEAATWRAPMERTRPEYPGALILNLEMPIDSQVVRVYKAVLASDDPVGFGLGNEQPLPADVAKKFNEQSQLAMVVYPKVDKPYMFGIHQCSRPRVWTPEERRLLKEIGRRLEGALTSLLINRELRQSENRYRRITEDLTDYQYSVRVEDGRVVETSQSPACETVTGYTPEEFAADPYLWFQMIAPEDRELVQERIQQVLAGKEIPPIEHRIIRKDGAMRWVYDTTILFKDASGQLLSYEGVIKDITERKQAEEQIKASLREKEVMLQEIHHRVKNNLQVISSLLDMQADTIDDPRLLQAFQDSQQRVRSMALVHEKLYQSADLAHIDFADYVQEMVDYLFMLYSYRARHIIPRLEVDEGFLEIDQAIPCGLIINELVSNALKHAFPPPLTSPPVGGIEGKQPFPTPEIRVAFAAQDGECVLVVGDNGVGLPPELDIETSSSLGLQLVNILVRQLQGSLEIDRHKGATFKLTFPEHQPKRRAITPQP